MKISALFVVGLPVAFASAAEKSGHAEASLLPIATTYQPGKPLSVGIKLRLDPGWHTYWINPGEGGMPTSAKWTLPDGWKAGELRHPVPKRFMTGELPGFGYEGEAVYLVDLTPPTDASGEAEVKVRLSWLTCNDSACVPGDAELSLRLSEGAARDGENAGTLEEASKRIPQEAGDIDLKVEESGGRVVLNVTAPESIDLEGAVAYPATPQALDPGSEIIFARKGAVWTAEASKNEYAEGELSLLNIVLTGGKLDRPLAVSWRKAE